MSSLREFTRLPHAVDSNLTFDLNLLTYEAGIQEAQQFILPAPSSPEPDLLMSLLFQREQVYSNSSTSFASGLANTSSYQESHNNLAQPITAQSQELPPSTFRSKRRNEELEVTLSPNRSAHYFNSTNTMTTASTTASTTAKRSMKKPIMTRSKSRTLKATDNRSNPRASLLRVSKMQRTVANSSKKVDFRQEAQGLSSNQKNLSSEQNPIVIDSDSDETMEENNANSDLEDEMPSIVPCNQRQAQDQVRTFVKDEHEGHTMETHEESDDAEVKRRHMEVFSALAAKDRELVAEREKLQIVIKEKVQLSQDLKESEDISRQLSTITAEIKALKAKHTTPNEELEGAINENADLRKKLAQAQEEVTNAQDLERKGAEQQMKNSELVQEIEKLKAEKNLPSWRFAMPSPAPSSSISTDDEKKLDNIRKTYAKVKRRFDNLHSIAINITKCTRSMDLSSFGEFGQYLRKLKAALDEDG